jgi:hypothetical protein
MKVLLLIGALLGFAIGFAFSWAEESTSATCLWHACLAAYVTSMLMRWWGTAWHKSLQEALRERNSHPVKANKS